MTKRNRSGSQTKKDQKYVESLKLLIMDEVYEHVKSISGAREIIAHWFEINHKASLAAWLRMDRVSIADLWQMMKIKYILN